MEIPVSKPLCFDGFVCVGTVKHYVQALRIQDCSVEGYGDDEYPGVSTYLQSVTASKDRSYEIWYRLGKATPNYQRFHEPFLWVAQLSKHVLDYIEEQPPRSVMLSTFRTTFYLWLAKRFNRNTTHFSSNNEFQRWHAAFNHQTDFRIALNAYIEYTYHQAFNLPNSKHLLGQPLWGECMAKGLRVVKPQQPLLTLTLATPDVYACFKHMYFGKQIQKKRPLRIVEIEQERRKHKLGFSKNSKSDVQQSTISCQPYRTLPVKVGDIVALTPEKKDEKVWKNTTWDWLAYVQAVQLLDDGTERLFVLWIYRHYETNICKAEYPFENEVFLSDNCNCTEGELLSTDIKGKYDLDWCPSPIDANRLFIRQTYITQDSAFISVRDEHKKCICRTAKDPFPYRHGDTVYLERTLHKEQVLDPVLVHKVNTVTGSVTVRRLLQLQRCTELAAKAHRADVAPNELVLTDDYETVAMPRIRRRCFVKFVAKASLINDRVPFPYNLGGAGDLWFISMGLVASGDDQNLVYLRDVPRAFKQGPNITSERKLRGLSIFSGGGSLDRGLEEGGAVEFHTAVDFSPEACHTQRANARDPAKMHIYCGSVDDYLDRVLTAKDHKLVARIGEVDMIAAGSPCPGFSSLQQYWQSLQSLRNASHITTFCSFVDVYRPLYGILENVVNMASMRKGYEDQNVLSQVVASLVSMGYQVNQYIMDAWCYSSKQQRSRLILTIAAPGLNPILQPWHTHRRAHEDTRGRCLGWLPNGERFGQREYYPTPFAHIPAGKVSADLPDIGNSLVQACIPFPDHRLSGCSTRDERALLTCIPKSPPGCGYNDAERLGLIPKHLKRPNRSDGKSYTRIKEAGLVPTITTRVMMRDKYNGASVHWGQDRSISILEARRAQGYPDNEPIIGNLAEQYKIVGNGVDRKVAFAMGLSLFHATEKNNSDFTANGRTPSSSEAYCLTDSAEESCIGIDSVGSHTVPISEVDGVSKESLRTSKPLHSSDDSLNASEVLKRLPGSRANSIGRLSLSSPSSLSTTQTSPAPRKRNREQEPEGDVETTETSCPSEHPRKRAKPGRQSWPSTMTATNATDRKVPTSSNVRSSSLSAKRQTRHSGLTVEFMPKQWNKRPEEEHGHS